MGHARGVLVRVDERGKENGGGGSGWRLLTARWKEGGSRAGVHVGEKEERRGGWCGGQHRPVANGHRWVAC
jgi:hypothetical protein